MQNIYKSRWFPLNNNGWWITKEFSLGAVRLMEIGGKN